MAVKTKLVCGVGINDADYIVQQTVNGKRVPCHFYQVWKNMIMRCYSAKVQAKYHTYIGCSVSESWLIFSNFKSWMIKQDWHGKQLDKDLLIAHNKIYSAESCVFIDRATNKFITDSVAARGEYPVGVGFHKSTGKIRARCNNQFTGKLENLGYFSCPEKAHQAWKKRKHELALQLADLQNDERVAQALRVRYL